MESIRLSLLLALVTCLLSTTAVAQEKYAASPLTPAQYKAYELDAAFYKKGILIQDILIATSDKVADVAISEAAYQFDKLMQRIDEAVATRIREKKLLCVLVGNQELTSDVPQFKTDKTGEDLDFYNWRQRGFLTWKERGPLVLFAEEDVLELEGGMQIESILIHEFAHVIHRAGFDKVQQDKLSAAFKAAHKAGIWHDGLAAQRFRRVKGPEKVSLLDALTGWFKEETEEMFRACLEAGDITVNGEKASAEVMVNEDDDVRILFGGPKKCYAARNRSEYWAEGVQCWYDTNRIMDHDHNHIITREQLKDYDKPLAALCAEVLGDDPWRIIPTRKRAGKDHLESYDPGAAPPHVQLPHIKAAANDFFDEYWSDFWQRLYDKHGLRSPRTAPLFNGKDLEGWSVDVPHLDKDPDGVVPFIARDGKLVSLGNPQGHLVHEKVSKDYRLEVSYRFTGKPGNCGVLVHSSTPRALYKMFPKSIEVQMYHKNAGDFWCIVEDIVVPDMVKRRGAIEKWGVTEGKARRILNLTDGSEKEPGEWNEMVIECLQREVKVWINGDFVNHGSDCTALRGKIALQAEGAEVEFRKLDFTPINMLSE